MISGGGAGGPGAVSTAACPPSCSGMLSSHPGHAENKQARLYNKGCYFSFIFVAIATYTYSKCKPQAFVSLSAVLKIRIHSLAKCDLSQCTFV